MNLQAPPHVTQLLNDIVAELRHLLGTHLVGVYVHGSLAMGCFNPHLSDIDFLAVTDSKLRPEQRKALASVMIKLAERAPAKGLEMSILTTEALTSFRHPTPYEFHFSNSWRERYTHGQFDFADDHKVDADLAAHLTITRERGITLYGQPIELVVPDIPTRYYTESILGDANSVLADMSSDPVYSVLNLCRVWAYLEDGQITSKREGGEWALQHATPFQKDVIEQALAEYIGRQPAPWDTEALNRFGQEMADHLRL
jgi:streptomycin 3"-adenylyltransferase